MSVLGSNGPAALKYWGTILASAYKRDSTADVYVGIRNSQAEYGLPTLQASVIDISVIRGFATRIANGARAFDAASPGDSITSSMMAVAPYTSNSYDAIAVNPTYQVRYQVTMAAPDGSISTVWSQSVYTTANFPGTVGELQDSVQFNATQTMANAAQQTGGASGGTVLSTGSIEISVV